METATGPVTNRTDPPGMNSSDANVGRATSGNQVGNVPIKVFRRLDC
ncbi:MAG: hypothetical protein HDR84_00310 [Bacteroides sp.]|nr:hypothetical protein [Bacteroides sp.]